MDFILGVQLSRPNYCEGCPCLREDGGSATCGYGFGNLELVFLNIQTGEEKSPYDVVAWPDVWDLVTKRPAACVENDQLFEHENMIERVDIASKFVPVLIQRYADEGLTKSASENIIHSALELADLLIKRAKEDV